MAHSKLTQELHQKWADLRRWRISGSVLVDYRIVKNHARRIIKDQEPNL